jgi:hypothetical protein
LSRSAPDSRARCAQLGAVGHSWCRSLAAVFPGLVIDSVRVKGSSGGGAGAPGGVARSVAGWRYGRCCGHRVRKAGTLLPGDALLRVDDSVLRIGAEDAAPAVLRERSFRTVWEPWLRGRMTAKVLIRGRDKVLGTHTPGELRNTRASHMLTDVRFAHERRHVDDHELAVRDEGHRHVGGRIVTRSRRWRHPWAAPARGQEVLPRRLRSSAPGCLRCGPACPRLAGSTQAGLMCTLSSPTRARGRWSCPQIVCTARDGTCVCRVPSNIRPSLGVPPELTCRTVAVLDLL